MTHRAESILAAVESTLDGDDSFAVLRSPVDALNWELQQVPAACVFMGEEIPRGDNGFEVMGSYDAVMTIYIDLWDQADQSTNIETKLLELRKLTHIQLMQSNRLGLSYVINIAPFGAEEPELSPDGRALTGKLRSLWIVEYRTSVTDPSA